MAVTYEEARQIVRLATEPNWQVGTYCLDDRRIVENGDLFVFEVGAREFLIDGDFSFAIAGHVPVVHKEDGQLEWLPSPTIATDPFVTSRPNPEPTLQVDEDG